MATVVEMQTKKNAPVAPHEDEAMLRKEGARVECQNMSFTVGKGKSAIKILNNLDICFVPGELTALMGPSGAGKTTLLNVLAGRASGTVQGLITVDGAPLNPARMKMMTNTVPQHDILMACLTARKALQYAADMRLKCSAAEKAKKIDNVLHELGLTEYADVIIGDDDVKGLSGGQRKRVSIALELLTEPRVLFLDEPTSGLDSKIAEDVVNVLKRLAQSGRTIICTIHQPSDKVFKTFDKLVLLRKGNLVYHSLARKLDEYFTFLGSPTPSGTSAAEHFFNLLSVEKPEKFESFKAAFLDWEGSRDTSSQKFTTPAPTSPKVLELEEGTLKYEVGWGTQVSAIFRRHVYKTINEKMIGRVRIAQNVFMGLLVSSIYAQLANTQATYQDRLSVLFLLVMMNVMTTVMATILVMPVDKNVFLKEYRNGYYPVSAYYIASVACNLMFQVFYGTILASVTYWIIGFYGTAQAFAIYLSVFLLVGMIGALLGYGLGCIFPNVQAAVSLVPMIIMPLTMFSGLLIQPDSIPIYWKWMYYISVFQYAFQILVCNEMKDRVFNPCDQSLPRAKCPLGYCNSTPTNPFGIGLPSQGCPGTMIIDAYSYVISDQWKNWIIIGSMFAFFFIFSYVCLYKLSRRPV